MVQERDEGYMRHFDSYGLPPFGEMAKRLKKEGDACRIINYRTRRLQGSGATCGYFCLYFALYCVDPIKYPMTVFKPWDLEWNDTEVVRLTRLVFTGI